MKLIHHAYSNKPSRYFIDGCRVSQDAFEMAKIKARIGHRLHCCFVTRSRPPHRAKPITSTTPVSTERPDAMLPDNERRADCAQEILKHYKRLAGDGLSDDEALRDLISDLGHFADRSSLDFIHATERAIAYWTKEQSDPTGLADPPDVYIIINPQPEKEHHD